ncbi:DUF711 family protein [Acidianus sp. HS-5]|uniref:DUF711 family protein n=1 Tax=Acidianus sp. HS-5 TaxID=2886040 RepID=UPI001F1DE478|nr:DUF711 family protein [Acidianus sp. HS-5]BDC19793.1 hypothetical protein HS5_26830 [Acidianus sp. HS-5]
MKIRAVTAFVTDVNKDKIMLTSSKLDSIKDEDILTKRISLPQTPLSLNFSKLLDLVEDKSKIFSLISIKDKDKRLQEIRDVLSAGENIYANVLITSPSYIDGIINLISKLEPSEASRFALLINDYFLLTPYFPTSTADVARDSLGLSLLYVNDFKEKKAIQNLEKADARGKMLESKTGLKYIGIDISLSPWGEESVGKLIEERSGKKIFSRGHIWSVGELNRELFSSAWEAKISPIGYSEVMLPVGEDVVLTKRVEEESLTLSQLLSMTFSCAAGLDMVGIEEDKELYKNIIKDAIAIQFVKKRPYGIRIIPSRGEKKIYIKEFGYIPTIKVV